MRKPIPPAARDILQATADYHGVSVGEILGTARHQNLVNARVSVAQQLLARGYSGSRIAAVLLRDPTTIYSYLGRTKASVHKTVYP